ncbi:acyl transferase [Aureitalea marina]|uniref:Acyl transferase n=1 Tax=Aureitalea marina TaxID=930804 RepID=A0A2S7KT77_9FLAO|nr:acyl transferase [Aureitalea marina]PQB05834.1 acyl transferase [Aureitalea marina]
MWIDKIFNHHSDHEFSQLALEIFRYQFEQVAAYNQFCQLVGKTPGSVEHLDEIPFIPIELFKDFAITDEPSSTQMVFSSSGTTGSITSKHFVRDLEIYQLSADLAFRNLVGEPEKIAILALLPAYLERNGSSLIYMVDRLMRQSNHPESGFYLDDLSGLANKLRELDASGQPTLLIGVSFALLDLLDDGPFKLKNTVVMETGGMKGRRKEMVRAELHHELSSGFGVDKIWSEYGMTELLSQAYSKGDGIFCCPPWMKVMTRDPEDPFSWVQGPTGGINVIDLANVHSCSFIATQDLGRVKEDGAFEVLGRFDQSDIRGCNLMVI